MNYADLLKKNGVKPEETSKKIQGLIKDLLEVNAGITAADNQLAENNLSAAKRKELEKRLKAAKEAVLEMDQELVETIEAWLPRREEFAKKAKALQEGKAKKQVGAAPAATPAAAPAAPNEPAAGTKKATSTPSADGKPAPAAAGDGSTPVETKKKSFGWGWAVGAVIVLVGAVVGVNMANKVK